MSKIAEAHEYLIEWCKEKDIKIELSPDNWMNILECMGDYNKAKTNVALDIVSEPLPTMGEAGVIALGILEDNNSELTDQEQTFFVAGFSSCAGYLSKKTNAR